MWTINEAARAGFYREIDVGGIITDRLFELPVRLNDDYSMVGVCARNELDADPAVRGESVSGIPIAAI